LLLGLAAKAQAATYYVDNTITDTNVGSATPDCTNYNTTTYTCSGGSLSAYATIADINAFSTLAAGDSVLFRKGQTWREQLTVPASGTSGNVITFGAYGTSDIPIISGADVLSSMVTSSAYIGGYVTLDGTTAKYLSTPATAGNVLSGTSFRLEVDAALDDYTTSSEQDLISKDVCCTDTNRHFDFILISNNFIVWLFDGAGGAWMYASADISSLLTDGTRYKLRADIVPDDSSGGSSVTFYYSTDGITYTQIGSPATGTNHALNANNTDIVTVGRRGDAAGAAAGKFYRARAWSDITGTILVLDMNVDDDTAAATSWTSSTTGETWTVSGSAAITGPTNTTLYYQAKPTQPNQVFRDGARITQIGVQDQLSTGYWWWNSGNSQVWIYDNPSEHIVEASQRDNAIYGFTKSYVTVQNLQTEKANSHGVYFHNGGVEMVIADVTTAYNYHSGVRFNGTASSNHTISNSNAIYNGYSGLDAYATGGWMVDNNTVHDNCQSTVFNYCAGIKVEPGTDTANCTVTNNLVYSNGIGNTDWRGAGIWLDTAGTGCVIKYNKVYSNNLMGIYLDASNGDVVAYNVIYSNGQTGAIDGGGIAVYGDSRPTADNLVYGNTVRGNRGHGIIVQGSNLQDGCTSNIVKNNISVGVVSGTNFTASGGCENPGINGSGNIYTYNNFGSEVANFIEWGSGVYKSTYADFDTAYGSATHSITGDPIFTNAAGNDFTLQSTSPAINAGTNLGSDYDDGLSPASTWPSSVTTIDQDLRGSGWEIGAYVYPVPQVPTIGTPQTLSASSIRWNFTDNAGDETGFRLYGGSDILSATRDLSYLDETSLSCNTSYSGRYVEAYNSYGYSTASGVASSVSTLSCPGGGGIMTGPGGLKAPEIPVQTALSAPTPAEGGVGVPTPKVVGTPFVFTSNLKLGMKGNDVKQLQIFLNQRLDVPLAKSGAGSPGNETDFFGPLTKAAVIRYQEQHAQDILAPWNLTKGTGFVGRTTRAKINEMMVNKR